MGKPAVGKLRHRPGRLLALQHVEADVDLARDLDAGEADLAVAHRRVHVAHGEHAAGLAHGEEDLRAFAVEMVVEIAAVPAGEPVRERLAVGRDADDADHRAGRKRDALVLPDHPVLHLEQAGERRLHLLDQLPEAGDERCDAPLDRTHVEDLDDERVARLGALHRHRACRAVDARHVDRRDQVVLASDLAAEAVVRLEGDDVAGLDLEHRDEVGAERPDDLVPGEAMHHVAGTVAAPPVGSGSARVAGAASVKRSSTWSRARFGSSATTTSPATSHPSATQFA